MNHFANHQRVRRCLPIYPAHHAMPRGACLPALTARNPSHGGMPPRCLQTSFSPALMIDIARPRSGSDALPRSYIVRFQQVCRVAPRHRPPRFVAGAGAPGCATCVRAASTSSPRAAGAPKGRARTDLAYKMAGMAHALALACSARRRTPAGGRKSAWRRDLGYQRANRVS